MVKQHSPQSEEVLQQHFRDNGRLDDSNSHPTLLHLTPGSPAALPIQRREATASVIASGHENGERGRGTAIGHSDHPGEHAKATVATSSSNSRDWSHQSDLGEVTSGQKTATGHTETTRANAMKLLVVLGPPTTAPRPRKGKQQTRRCTPTSSRLLNRAQKAEQQREQQDRSRQPSDQERAQSTFPASQAEDREAREES